jgi:cation diffusion facilitator CzcD-associated flavoprotein CzcO
VDRLAGLDARVSAQKRPMTVAVVGGGWAGLAAAVELAAHGQAVILLEAARGLGGRARSVDWDGIRIDNGQHLFIGAYRETLRLMRRVGSADRLERRALKLTLPSFVLTLPRLPARPAAPGVGPAGSEGVEPGGEMVGGRLHAEAAKIAFPTAP